jgi:membrane protease YdiL (CAAX protease family)
MLENDLSSRPKRGPFASLLLFLIVIVLGFMVIGPIISFFLVLPFYPGTMLEFIGSIQDPLGNPDIKVLLYIMQGVATFVGLIVGPAWFLTTEQKSMGDQFRNRPGLIPILLTGSVVIVFMAVNSVFIQWNASVHFPEFAKGFESWAREREDLGAAVTKLLTDFDNIGQLLLAILVIAVIPAFGEEIVFRGIIQNQLHRATGNIHVSIFTAAILFSAMHLQFFGFVPRVLLGALFGYLYYWSGNLWFAVFAHFVNNCFSVLAVYFYQRGSFNYDLESPEAVPANFVVISALVTGGLLFYFYKYFQNQKTQSTL